MTTGRLFCTAIGTDDEPIMMELISLPLAWVNTHEEWLLGLAVVSVVVFLASLASAPWLVCRIPTDYFRSDQRPTVPWARHHPLIRWPLLGLKNLGGVLLLAAGIAMLVLPGQGLLTMLAGLVLLDFPGKYRFERWLVRQPAVLRTVNWLRQRHGRQPLRW